MVMDKFQLSAYKSAGLGYDFDFIYSLLANNYSILVLGFREMVFCFKNCFDLLSTVRKNCSSDREKLLKFESEGREFSKKLRSLGTICLNSERFEQFWKENYFLIYSWRFLRSDKLEQLEFKLEKIIGI